MFSIHAMPSFGKHQRETSCNYSQVNALCPMRVLSIRIASTRMNTSHQSNALTRSGPCLHGPLLPVRHLQQNSGDCRRDGKTDRWSTLGLLEMIGMAGSCLHCLFALHVFWKPIWARWFNLKIIHICIYTIIMIINMIIIYLWFYIRYIYIIILVVMVMVMIFVDVWTSLWRSVSNTQQYPTPDGSKIFSTSDMFGLFWEVVFKVLYFTIN